MSDYWKTGWSGRKWDDDEYHHDPKVKWWEQMDEFCGEAEGETKYRRKYREEYHEDDRQEDYYKSNKRSSDRGYYDNWEHQTKSSKYSGSWEDDKYDWPSNDNRGYRKSNYASSSNYTNTHSDKDRNQANQPTTAPLICFPLPAEPHWRDNKLMNGPSEMRRSELPCFFYLLNRKCERKDCQFQHPESLLDPKFKINREQWIDLLDRRKPKSNTQEEPAEVKPKSRAMPPKPEGPPPNTKSNMPKYDSPIGSPRGSTSGPTTYYAGGGGGSAKMNFGSIKSNTGRVWRKPQKDRTPSPIPSSSSFRDRDRPRGNYQSTQREKSQSLSPNNSDDEDVRSADVANIQDNEPTEEEDAKQYQIEIPNPNTKFLKDKMLADLCSMLEGITKHLKGRDSELDHKITNEELPTPILTYACSVLVLTGWVKSDLHKIKYMRDEDGFIWLWIKFRVHDEDRATFTKLKSASDSQLRFIHGTTEAGNFGIARNAHHDKTNPILPQQGSLMNRKYVPLSGLFALAWELSNDDDQNWGEMKKTLDVFKSHGKNQIGIGWTGTITGVKKGGKNASWSAQLHLHKSKDAVVTCGGRVYCIRANKAVVDGIFINTGYPAPTKYNTQQPFIIG